VAESNLFEDFIENLSFNEKMAHFLAKRIGSMGFLYILFFTIIFWVLLNIFTPLMFDPAWDFTILFFILGILDILFTPLLLVGQKISDNFAKKKEEADHERNKNIEMHLLQLEEMLIKLVPNTYDKVSFIEGSMEEVSKITMEIPDEISKVLKQEKEVEEIEKRKIQNEENSNKIEISVKKGTPGLGNGILTLEFFPIKEEEVWGMLRLLDFPENIEIFDSIYNAQGNKIIKIIYPMEQEDNVVNKIRRVLDNTK